jgi:hypothetical protein
MSFHESYDQGEIKPPNERSTGLVFAAAAVIFAFGWRHHAVVPWVGLGAAAVFAALALLKPQLLGPLNIFWFRLGLALHKIVNPIVMFALFAVAIIPAGLVTRIFWDPLYRRRNPSTSSYWIESSSSGQPRRSMKNQF